MAVTTCYRYWPQLNYDAIYHELLQLGANFGYPAFLCTSFVTWSAQRWLGCTLLAANMDSDHFFVAAKVRTRLCACNNICKSVLQDKFPASKAGNKSSAIDLRFVQTILVASAKWYLVDFYTNSDHIAIVLEIRNRKLPGKNI